MLHRLLFLFLLAGSSSFAQQIKLLENKNHIPSEQLNFVVEDPCSRMNPSNNFEISASMGAGSEAQLIANDLLVEANEVFYLDQLVLNLWTSLSEGVDEVDVYVWSNLDGLPNEILFGETTIVPTEKNLLEFVDESFYVYETIIDLSTPFSLEGGAIGNTYWVQVVGYSNGSVGWEVTSASFDGEPLAFDAFGMWDISDTYDGVYSFNGECESLGLESQNLEEIKLYPNPVKDVLQLDIPIGMNIENVLLQNSLGQNLVSRTDNFQSINMLDYASGLYIVTVKTRAGSVSKKVIKN